MTRFKRREPAPGEAALKEFRGAKRRSVVGMECAAARIRDAMARFLNPTEWGEPGELDRWILLHMSDADFPAAGYARLAKVLKKKRDEIAASMLPDLIEHVLESTPPVYFSFPCAIDGKPRPV